LSPGEGTRISTITILPATVYEVLAGEEKKRKCLKHTKIRKKTVNIIK
jgi:hypothetical protein